MTQDCIIRQFGGCSCKPGECLDADRRYHPAPVITFTWRDQAAVIALGLVVALIAAGTMHALDRQEREYQISRRV